VAYLSFAMSAHPHPIGVQFHLGQHSNVGRVHTESRPPLNALHGAGPATDVRSQCADAVIDHSPHVRRQARAWSLAPMGVPPMLRSFRVTKFDPRSLYELTRSRPGRAGRSDQ